MSAAVLGMRPSVVSGRRGAVGLGAVVAILALAAGCAAEASSTRPGSARDAARLGLRSLAGTGRPANAGLSASVSECLGLRHPSAGVAAYAADGARLPFDVFAGHEPGTDPRCRAGQLRVLRLAALEIDGRLTYLRRGGCQTPCVVREATVHVPASAFSGALDLLPVAARRGDGAPLADCRATRHDAPQLAGPVLARMFYKRPSETPSGRPESPDTGARWSNYGDPGRLYRRGSATADDYNYLLWNLPRTARGVLHGGGIAEAVLARGTPLELCPAAHLVLPAFASDGALDGEVEFGYAELHQQAGAPLFGWVLLSYTYRGHRQTLTA
jgi:hypothetical protein